MRSSYPTAALAILDFDIEHWAEVRKGAARLNRFVTPAALRGDDTGAEECLHLMVKMWGGEGVGVYQLQHEL